MNNFLKAFKKFDKYLSGGKKENWQCVLMQPLNQLVSSIQSPFVETGILNDKTLLKTTLRVDGIDCGTLANLNVAKLKTLTKPSPFGRGNETVYDESVRKAYEIEANRISFDGFVDFAEILVPKIEQINVPRFMKMELRMYKTIIYDEGGFFDKHIDTLHGSNHFATLLLCLPSQHEGGTLLVSHGKETKRIEFDKMSSDNQLFQWACFFTDCVHEVQPVTKGTRVLIQFDVNLAPLNENIYSNYEEVVGNARYGRNNKKNSETMKTGMLCNSIYLEKISDFLEEVLTKGIKFSSIVSISSGFCDKTTGKNKVKRIQPQGIAFILRHMYHSEALTSDLLKGSDDILFRHLSSCPKFQVSLTPIILECKDYLDNEYIFVEAYPFPKEIQMLASGINLEKEKSDTIKEGDKEEKEIETEEGKDYEKGPIFLISGSKEDSIKLIKYVSGAEHTGNESAAEENYYFAGAMVVKLKD